jgi:DNA repair ATPase RecN
LKNLDLDFGRIKTHIEKKAAERDLLMKQLQEQKASLDNKSIKMDTYQKVIILLQKTSDYARSQMKQTIEFIVTNALQVVFAQDIRFEIELGTRAGAPTAEFYVVDAVGLRYKPMEARGGGLVDVISTALRLSILELYQPKIEGPVILDEAGKHISSEYAENFAYFLKEYCKRIGRQCILITHSASLAAVGDKSFFVSIKNGVSEVKET